MGHERKKQITIYPTNKCNMQCIYCVSNSSAEQSCIQEIDMNFVKRGILDYFILGGGHQLRFYGSGEPTQAMSVVKNSVKFAREIVGDDLLVEMQTNAYFDSDIAHWIANNIDIVWVSIDAWPEINNRLRPVLNDENPSKRILENIKILKNKTFVGVRATIVEETVLRQTELVDYFKELGIKYVYAEPIFEPVMRVSRSKNKNITRVDIGEFAEGFMNAWNHSLEVETFYGNSFIVNFDEKVKICCRSCLPTPHLTTDGYVSACDLGFYGNSPLSDLIYGRFDLLENRIDYYPEKIRKLRSRTAENMKRCRECNLLYYCAGGCMGRAYHETGDIFGVVDDYCWLTKYFAKYIPVGKIKIDYLHP